MRTEWKAASLKFSATIPPAALLHTSRRRRKSASHYDFSWRRPPLRTAGNGEKLSFARDFVNPRVPTWQLQFFTMALSCRRRNVHEAVRLEARCVAAAEDIVSILACGSRLCGVIPVGSLRDRITLVMMPQPFAEPSPICNARGAVQTPCAVRNSRSACHAMPRVRRSLVPHATPCTVRAHGTEL